MKAMRPAKYHIAVALSAALLVALSYSQVCYLNCAFYGCSQPESVERPAEQSGHCPQHQSEPEQREPDGSQECPSHAELSVLTSSRPVAIQGLYICPDLEISIPINSFITVPPPDASLIIPDDAPLRAPPTHSVLRI
jgi:hypothetical protein